MLSHRRGAGYHLNETSGQPWLPVTCVIHFDRILRGFEVGTFLTGWMYMRSDHVPGLLKRERGRYNLMSAATVWPIGRLKRPPVPSTRQGGLLRYLFPFQRTALVGHGGKFIDGMNCRTAVKLSTHTVGGWSLRREADQEQIATSPSVPSRILGL